MVQAAPAATVAAHFAVTVLHQFPRSQSLSFAHVAPTIPAFLQTPEVQAGVFALTILQSPTAVHGSPMFPGYVGFGVGVTVAVQVRVFGAFVLTVFNPANENKFGVMMAEQ